MPDLSTRPLRVASLLAEDCRDAHLAAARHVCAALGCGLERCDDAGMDEVAAGAIDLAFVCSLPAALMLATPRPAVAPLGAPLLRGPRYAARPVYYADLLVRSDDAADDFASLRGRVLAYNEPISFSGYRMLQWYLHTRGEDFGYFGALHRCGSHAAAMRAVLDGAADCAAIDSQVLAAALNQDPELAVLLRRISTLGPHPAPPVLISRALPSDTRVQAGRALLDAHRDERVATALERGAIVRFAAVSPRDYAALAPVIDALAIEPWF